MDINNSAHTDPSRIDGKQGSFQFSDQVSKKNSGIIKSEDLTPYGIKGTQTQGNNKIKNNKDNTTHHSMLKFLLEIATKYIVLFVILLSTAAVAFFIVFTPSKTVSVPNLVGKSFVDASVLLQEHQLFSEITQQYTADPSDIGKVIKQSPRAGMPIRTKRVVTLTVSKGTVVTEVPDLVGFTQARAEDVINSQFAGFENLLRINSIVKLYSEKSPGTIIGQSPDAGTKISNAGTKIDLLVSRGNNTNAKIMHDVIGLPYEQVLDYLQALGNEFEFYFSHSLKPTSVETQNYYLPSGIILEQAPELGANIDDDMIIRIGIRKLNLDQEGVLVEPENLIVNNRTYPIKILTVPVKGISGIVTINKVIDSEIVYTMQVAKFQTSITLPYEERPGVLYEGLLESGSSFWRYQVPTKNNDE